jgi:predicted kinase
MARLFIICGLPCSGKTTLARELESRHSGFRLCPDEWIDHPGSNLWDEALRAKIESLQWMVGQRLLQLETNVIIEWGTWGRSERDALREGARWLGATVELHFLDAPVEELFRRAQQRAMEDPPITREQLKSWSDQFERPDHGELALYDHPLG